MPFKVMAMLRQNEIKVKLRLPRLVYGWTPKKLKTVIGWQVITKKNCRVALQILLN